MANKIFNVLNNISPRSSNISSNPLVDTSTTDFRNKEAQRIVSRYAVPDVMNQRSYAGSNPVGIFGPLVGEKLVTRIEYEKLIALAPDIPEAASIIIPSILSPNNFKPFTLELAVRYDLKEDVQQAIIKLLKNHFDTKLKISDKLYGWIDEAFYRQGSKPLLIIPSNCIAALKDNLFISSESINSSIDSLNLLPIESLTLDNNDSVKFDDKFVTNLSMSSESFNAAMQDMRFAYSQISNKRDAIPADDFINKLDTVKQEIFNDFTKRAKLEISFDYRHLLMNRIKSISESQIAIESIESQIESSNDKKTIPIGSFKIQQFLDLSGIEEKDLGDYPAFFELSGESTIPIAIEGSPNQHIGYLIAIGSNGFPVTVDNEDMEFIINSRFGNNRIGRIFSAMYGAQDHQYNTNMITDQAKSDILNSVYDVYLKKLLNNKLKSIGINSNSVELNNSISKIMFSRLLKGANTRFIFVPGHMVAYLAFDYHNDGSGKSRIEHFKHPISLKMTLVVARIMNLMTNAIRQRRLKFTADDNIGNIEEFMDKIRQGFASKLLGPKGFSYEPPVIAQSMANSALVISPSNIPGAKNFDLEHVDGSQNSYPTPDESLMSTLDDMCSAGLGVTQSDRARLRENDLATLITTNNAHFANKTAARQKVVKEFMGRFIHEYIRKSPKLKKDIKSIITDIEQDTKKMDSDIDSNTKNLSNSDSTLDNIIQSIELLLPKPNFVHNQADYNLIKEYTEMTTQIAEAIFNDDLARGDDNVKKSIMTLRALMKRQMILAYMKENTTFADIDYDKIHNINVEEIAQVQMTMNSIDNLFNALGSLNPVQQTGDNNPF